MCNAGQFHSGCIRQQGKLFKEKFIRVSQITKLTGILPRMALALIYGGMPTPLLTKLGPSLIFPKNAQNLEQNYEDNKSSKMESSHRLPRANSFKGGIGVLKVARAKSEADELERIDQNVVGHLDKLAGKSLKDCEDWGYNWKAVEHWFALLHWLQLDLDLNEIRQEAFSVRINFLTVLTDRRLLGLLPRLLLMAVFLALLLLLSRSLFSFLKSLVFINLLFLLKSKWLFLL